MAGRSIPVRFRVDDLDERDPETHHIEITDGGSDAPAILENPHVDFPGTWARTGTDGSIPVYELRDQVADTSETVGLDPGTNDMRSGGVADQGSRSPESRFEEEDFGVAGRDATPDDTVVRQPGIRETDDRVDRTDGDLIDGNGPARATRDAEVLMQDVGEGDHVSPREVRDQHDATRLDGGTGR